MRVLVTGADGQLGRCLQDRLALTDHDWIALNRHDLDITNADAVTGRILDFRPDVIINAAAYTAVDKAESDEDAAWQINAQAVAHLASAADAVGALLIHVSTDYVFDGSAKTPYRESGAVSPLGVYGASKLAGEQAAAKAARYLIVRTAWVFSEYGSNFLKTMLRVGADRAELNVVADQVGTPTYAGDLASALLCLAEHDVASGVYHFAGGQACTWHEFAQAIFAEAEQIIPAFSRPAVHPISTSDYPTAAQRPAFSVLDDSALRELIPDVVADWQKALPAVVRRIASQN